MIEAENGAQGLEIVREGDTIRFIGHFRDGITSEMVISVVDALTMFQATGTNEVSRGGQPIGLISWEPQGTMLFFPPNGNHDLIVVNSAVFEEEVKRLVQ